MTDSNIEKMLLNRESEQPKHVRKRNCTTKRPKIYGEFKDGSIVELADIKSSGVGFNGYALYYRVLAAINRDEGRG